MKCGLCDWEQPDAEGGLEAGIDHIRVMHPDQYEEPERWPDGGLVIHDDTLTAEEFDV
ncbi:MAG TPA: hypothetical protein VJL80_06235 [Aeromicrobium sp.]|nr:hypothetical protein [Aeromicrobium sp.]HKY57617.1 hypothetical protein [Aeromicrobium sp.]